MDKYTTPRNSSGISIEPKDYNALVSGYSPTCNTLPQQPEAYYPQPQTTEIIDNRYECLVCHKRSFLGTCMPYPSRYDGEWVCGDCVRNILDGAIASFIESAEKSQHG